MLIALHSNASRTGKSSIAGHLVRTHGFTELSYGGPIYHEVAPAFGVTVEQLGSDEWKRNERPELALIHCRDTEFVRRIIREEYPQEYMQAIRAVPGTVLTKPRTSRFILQHWATEYRRANNPRYWINILEDVFSMQPTGSNIVISDLREDPEVESLIKFTSLFYPTLRFGVIEVTRPGIEQKTSHSSDAGINRKYIDATICNNGTLESLYVAADCAVTSIPWVPKHLR